MRFHENSLLFRQLFEALLITILLALAVLLLGGCTIYRVHSEPGKSVDVKVYSTRSFEAPVLLYTRVGDDATFSFGADSATQPGINDYAAGVLAGLKAANGQTE